MTRLLTSAVLLFATGVTTATAGVAADEPPPLGAVACISIGGTPRRLDLADGRIVSIDVESIAVSGGLIFAVGNHGYVFQKDTRAYGPRKAVDSILGVIIDSQQRVTPVPNPIAPTRAFHPRVVAEPNGKFHVLFASGLDTVTFTTPFDTATLWHATFERGRWNPPARVGRFSGASLEAELASSLLERNGELSFAFSFIERRTMASDGGAIFLRRRRSGLWTADTLRTVNAPSVVRAALDRDGSVVVLLGLSEDIPGRVKEKIFLARFDSAWVSPTYFAGDGLRPITNPHLRRIQDHFIASWIDWEWGDPRTSRLRWATIDRTLKATGEQWIDSGVTTYPFEMAVVDSQFPMWLYHAEMVGEAIAVVIAADSVVARLAPIRAPFRSPFPSTVALSGNRFAVFTQITARTPDELLAASYMTPLEIRCPTTVRR